MKNVIVNERPKSNNLKSKLKEIIDQFKEDITIDEIYQKKLIDKDVIDELLHFIDIVKNNLLFINQFSNIEDINEEIKSVNKIIKSNKSHYKTVMNQLKVSNNSLECRNIKISKIYDDISNLENDNNSSKKIFKDKEFDNSINLLTIYYNLIKKYKVSHMYDISDSNIKHQFDIELLNNIENYFFYLSHFDVQNISTSYQMISDRDIYDKLIY